MPILHNSLLPLHPDPVIPPLSNTDARRALALARSFVVVFLAVLVATRFFRVNVSPSVPYGLYRLTAVPPVLARGMLVMLPVPASVQPWHSRWVPFLKPVAAVAGEEVCVRDDRLWVAGVAYGPVYAAVAGKRLPRLAGCQVIPEGAVFLASTAPRSLDGRYWGMTPVATLRTAAVPLLTWRK